MSTSNTKNVEIKAKISEDKFLELITELYTSEYNNKILEQIDVFYESPFGRVKLRIIKDEKKGQLIFYNRKNIAGPKLSDYDILIIDNPEKAFEFLPKAFGEIGRVKKTRRVYQINQTRVHLDFVENLGHFIE